MFNKDYQIIEASVGVIGLTGVLRLPSPGAYDAPFAPIYEKMQNEEFPTFVLDVTELVFLNSAGLTALAQLIIYCREHNIPLTLKGKKGVPWHEKSISRSLARLWKEMIVELV
ncbi:hypothetical protein HOG98_02625 [bacterium]|jgi:hypothetical protein|nr:hypothetical protein [bacterium]